jgi:hypothetical protein
VRQRRPSAGEGTERGTIFLRVDGRTVDFTCGHTAAFLCATAERSTERVDIPILLRVWIWEFGQPKDEKRKAKLENENKTLRPKGLSYSSESNLGKRKANPSASGRGRPRPEGRDDSRQLFQRINEKKPTFVLQGNQGPLRVQSAVQGKKSPQDAGATDYRARSLGEWGAACCAPTRAARNESGIVRKAIRQGGVCLWFLRRREGGGGR